MIQIGLAILIIVAAGYLVDAYLHDRNVDKRYRARLASLSRSVGGGFEGDEEMMETERLMARLMMSSSGITRRLMQADWKVTPERFVAFIAGLFVVAAVAIWFLGLLGGLAAGLAYVGLAYMLLSNAADKQVNAFLEELPNFLERLRQLVSTGNSQVQAFDKALAYSGDATRCYLDPVALRLKIGVPLPDALRVQAQRLGIAELAMLAMIVRTNLRYGGNLGYILEHLARVLRDRTRVRSEFKSLSSELRSTAIVMVAIPPLVAVAIMVMNPSYLDYFVEEGQTALWLAIGLEVVGILIMRRMMKVEY
ncbi:type II secretion system F family protein [Zavarzinia compransoris]|uniref:type II secretion system F family protein n=1 Tax=Zavarzinia marina TaxID=2911065 RepID=UPI001F3319F9|nr:type II secretion system F family protein [Zavarzinia marina]MCF4166121.1 type II secretion system F family protein [Zavarzinia marina]